MNNANYTLAVNALRNNAVVDSCKWFLGLEKDCREIIYSSFKPNRWFFQNTNLGEIASTKYEIDKLHKSLGQVIGILYTLELIDDWSQFKNIVEKMLEEPSIPPNYAAHNEYVVPVPNTGYIDKNELYPDCYYTTLKNLIAILCNGNFDKITNKSVKNYFETRYNNFIKNHANSDNEDVKKAFLESIMGTTDASKHKDWVNALPACVKTENAQVGVELRWLFFALDRIIFHDDHNDDSSEKIFYNYDSFWNEYDVIKSGDKNSYYKSKMTEILKKLTTNKSTSIEIKEKGDIKEKGSKYNGTLCINGYNNINITVKAKEVGNGYHIEIKDLRNTPLKEVQPRKRTNPYAGHAGDISDPTSKKKL